MIRIMQVGEVPVYLTGWGCALLFWILVVLVLDRVKS